MACPTCDHTMQKLPVENPPHFWCPRCGTLAVGLTSRLDTSAPKLVLRCREFAPVIHHVDDIVAWKRLGIAEAIDPPADRT